MGCTEALDLNEASSSGPELLAHSIMRSLDVKKSAMVVVRAAILIIAEIGAVVAGQALG